MYSLINHSFLPGKHVSNVSSDSNNHCFSMTGQTALFNTLELRWIIGVLINTKNVGEMGTRRVFCNLTSHYLSILRSVNWLNSQKGIISAKKWLKWHFSTAQTVSASKRVHPFSLSFYLQYFVLNTWIHCI